MAMCGIPTHMVHIPCPMQIEVSVNDGFNKS
jgi:hypothetical protein